MNGVAVDNPFFLFMHIPKAAGTTLRSIVDLQFGADRVLTYYNQGNRQLLDNLQYVLRDSDKEFAALIGHFPFGVHENLPCPAPYVTFLRDPVNIAISAFYENLKTNLGNFSKADGTPYIIGEYVLENPEFFENQQTKSILGTNDLDAPIDDLLAAAIHNLTTNFIFIGIVEKFAPSFLLLSKQLGWSPCTYKRLNQRRADIEVDAPTIKIIAELNEIDRALYSWAASQLDAKIAQAGSEFEDALKELNFLLPKDNPEFDHNLAECQFVDTSAPALHRYLDL
jgi:hypothetical protein